MNTEQRDLKLCPFCGGEAQTAARISDDTRLVQCRRCSAEVSSNSMARSIATWNKRAPLPAGDAVRDAIEAMPEYLPRLQKCRPAKTGFMAYMAKKKDETCEGDEYGWVHKGHVLQALAANREKGNG